MIFLGSFVNALVDVLAIIGIILVGGFLIFFLGDLVLSILDPNYKRFGKRKAKEEEKTEKLEKEEVKAIEPAVEKVEALEFKAEEPVVEPVVEPVKEEVVEEFKFDDEPVVEESAEEDGLKDLRAEEEIFRANMMKAIEERQAKKQEETAALNQFYFDDDDLNVFDDDEEENFEGITLEPEQEEVVEEVEEIVEEENNEAVEEVVEEAQTNEELEALKLEIAEQRRKFEEEKQALIAQNEELSRKIAEGEEVKTVATGSVEEYEERLATLKTRLAENDKELRKVKKEFLPLRKVAKTLENDEKKLRRKEALVAKQKVVLYGVNNYVDIDEEKAKKLAEDLDLLEGFRLSVQHCQEVMDANKERYPILERTFNILSQNNETIKSDIEKTESAIAALKANNSDENGDATEANSENE